MQPQPQPQSCAARLRIARAQRTGALTRHATLWSSWLGPIPFSEPAKMMLRFVFSGLSLCLMWRVSSVPTIGQVQPPPWCAKRSTMSTPPSVSPATDDARRLVWDIRDTGHCGRVRARPAIGVRSYGAQSTASVCSSWRGRSLSKRMSFLKVRFVFFRPGFIPSVSSRVVWSCYGLWQVQVGEIVGRRSLVGYDVEVEYS